MDMPAEEWDGNVKPSRADWRILLWTIAWMLSGAIAAAADGSPLMLGTSKLGVTLDASRNHALRSIVVEGTEFPSGGKFPCFVLFDRQGQESEYPAADARWQVTVESVGATEARLLYACSGLRIEVSYAVGKQGITISAAPKAEAGLKVRAITDQGSLVSIPSDVTGARRSGFILRPHASGELIRFPADRQCKKTAQAQSWEYDASFFALGYNGHGLIVRCPQYGALWTAATGDLNGVYSLMGGLTADYRPRRESPGPYKFWNLPLVEPRLDIVLVPVGDANGDGVFNWVDVGVAYRQKFIRRNERLDRSELGSMSGKLDMWGPHPNYSELIEQNPLGRLGPAALVAGGAAGAGGQRF